jgi:3-oxoacyl-[acyl-carrier protein] reductase
VTHRFDDKVAVVTGAAGGIGEAYARALHAEGASVVIADMDAARGEAVAASLGDRALFVATDVSDPASVDAMAAEAGEHFGGIDLLVNNAVDWDYYRRFMSVNMDGALVVTRACFRSMRKRGGGAIVNQSSTAAWLYAGFYGLAKVGVNGLTQQLAAELGGQGIRVNAIAPGPIDTEATRSTVPPEILDEIVKGLSLKRRGTPQDLVGMCLFLLSDEAAWITGQIFNVDGGQIIRS